MNEDCEIEEEGLNEEFEMEQVLRPKLFEDFEGQDKIVNNLKVFIEAATQREDALDHVLLHHPPLFCHNWRKLMIYQLLSALVCFTSVLFPINS